MQAVDLDTDVLADNVLAAVEQATPAQYAEGMAWYQAAHTFAVGLAEEHGLTVEQAAGVIAALSPQLPWDRNLTYAELLVRTGSAPTLGRSIRQANAILDGADPLDVLGGAKTRSFFANIFDPDGSHAVTIDRHALDVALGVKGTDKSRKLIERKGAYELVADAYRNAAERIGVLPNQAQAIAWVAWRNDHAWRDN